MLHRSTADAIRDLRRAGQVLDVTEEVDPLLEMAEIQRRVFQRGGPALLFHKVRGTRYPATSNLFGTMERARYLFRHTLRSVQRAVEFKADPSSLLRRPWKYAGLPFTGWNALPKRSLFPPRWNEISLQELPQIVSWPRDGGAFITLPQVASLPPDSRSLMKCNLGMYRVQISGNQFDTASAGLHYQIHRGLGVHHAQAINLNKPLPVSVFIGGPPAHTLAAVMPMPEGLSEVLFAGMLAGRGLRYQFTEQGHMLATDADFCITGFVYPEDTLPEGPFGDHLGYYSLCHPFPVLRVHKVYAKARNAIWPFTVVGRPPQEDTIFGGLIHEITGPMVPVSIPGAKALHAVDVAGVHPLLLAIGSERYVPYGERQPRELMTIAHAILGFNQASLAKYLLIAAHEDNPPDIHDIGAFLVHILERLDLSRDLHFITRTTMDTLDYSGGSINEGSKLILAAAGRPRRRLGHRLPSLPSHSWNIRVVIPGILAVSGIRPLSEKEAAKALRDLIRFLEESSSALQGWPLVVLLDDAAICDKNHPNGLNNFLWQTFTRSDPARDTSGAGEKIIRKHWQCDGPVVIDARSKPRLAPVLEPDPDVVRRVDDLGTRGKSLHGWV